VTRPSRRPSHSRLRRDLQAALFILPSLFGVVAFLLLPVVIVAVVSFFDWELLSTPKFVGLKNYRHLLADESMRHSLLVTVYYVVLSIPAQTILALLLAILLNQKIRGKTLFRAMYVVPWMATPVVMGLVWTWVFDPRNGAINAFLATFGITGPDWLTSSTFAMPAIAAVQVWQYTGYNMLFFLAGLQSIPKELYEVSSLDGASAVQQFFSVTLPMLRPTTFFVLVTNVIGSFQVFDTVFVMTNGGPGNSTEVINFKIYQTAFQFFDFGYASAIAMVLFVLILTVTLFQVRYFNKRTTYDVS
jgi:multiple sugar transport system permease protein/sn-glycerol 3-phosphate transport system permease protein